MLRANKIILLTLFTSLLLCCKPYNSDEANHKFIQGKWMLVDAERNLFDTINVDYNKQITYLIFNGNKCSQQMVDLNETSEYTFTISDFELNLHTDSVLNNTLHINLLTADSLILSKGENSLWKYKKIEQ
ncbi:lipocalin family protein [Dysgonomonas reticulitermitis]